MSRRQPWSGVAYARLGVALGGTVSVAANVAHAFLRPAGAGDGWHPELGAVLGAVFWPAALFVAIEVLTRADWPAGPWWRLLRFGGLLPIAAVAATVSYRHLSGLLDHYGEEWFTVTFGPIAVDGLMIVCTTALLFAHRTSAGQPGAVQPCALQPGTVQAPAVQPSVARPGAPDPAADPPARVVAAAETPGVVHPADAPVYDQAGPVVQPPAPAPDRAPTTSSSEFAGGATDRAEQAARRHRDQHGTLPTASELVRLTGVSRGTAGTVLKTLRTDLGTTTSNPKTTSSAPERATQPADSHQTEQSHEHEAGQFRAPHHEQPTHLPSMIQKQYTPMHHDPEEDHRRGADAPAAEPTSEPAAPAGVR
jgi:hypothetical protein